MYNDAVKNHNSKKTSYTVVGIRSRHRKRYDAVAPGGNRVGYGTEKHITIPINSVTPGLIGRADGVARHTRLERIQ